MRDVAPLRQPRRAPDRRRFSPPAPRPAPEPADEANGRDSHARTASPAEAVERVPAFPPHPSPVDLAGVDRRTVDRLRRGRYPVEARLDLHGMTQDQAHRALGGFVVAARVAGQRCVLVITGHGRISGGVLKAAVPRWLAEPALRAHVLVLAPARPPHGGGGALYLLLRRADR